MAKGYKKKNSIEAKCDFVDEMMKLGGISSDTDGTLPLDVEEGVLVLVLILMEHCRWMWRRGY